MGLPKYPIWLAEINSKGRNGAFLQAVQPRWVERGQHLCEVMLGILTEKGEMFINRSKMSMLSVFD